MSSKIKQMLKIFRIFIFISFLVLFPYFCFAQGEEYLISPKWFDEKAVFEKLEESLEKSNPSYAQNLVDNEDGTVSDLDTDLMWFQCSAGMGGSDCLTPDEPLYYNYTQATSYCDNSTLAGYLDWYLPDVKQLFTLLDYSLYPALNTIYFPNNWGLPNLSSTPGNYPDAETYYLVHFGYGYVIDAEEVPFRCVRDIPPSCPMTTELIQNETTGSEFYLDKTISYGDILMILFLIIFFVAIVFKLIWNFVFKQPASKL